jgi:ribosomal protein L31
MSEGRTSKAHGIVATFTSSRVEVGRDRNGFHSRTANDSEGIRLYLGYCGLINQCHPFYTCQDNVHRTSVGRVVHI